MDRLVWTALAWSILAAGRQEPSYNGVAAPAEWPPRATISRKPLATPGYLQAPPKVIPIDVGRQFFVDDFLIEATDLSRVHHVPEYHASNPVLGRGKTWDKDHAAPFSDGVWFDARDGLSTMFYWARGRGRTAGVRLKERAGDRRGTAYWERVSPTPSGPTVIAGRDAPERGSSLRARPCTPRAAVMAD